MHTLIFALLSTLAFADGNMPTLKTVEPAPKEVCIKTYTDNRAEWLNGNPGPHEISLHLAEDTLNVEVYRKDELVCLVDFSGPDPTFPYLRP